MSSEFNLDAFPILWWKTTVLYLMKLVVATSFRNERFCNLFESGYFVSIKVGSFFLLHQSFWAKNWERPKSALLGSFKILWGRDLIVVLKVPLRFFWERFWGLILFHVFTSARKTSYNRHTRVHVNLPVAEFRQKLS